MICRCTALILHLKQTWFSVAEKAKAEVMTLFQKLILVFMTLFTVFPHGAKADLKLETWKVYGQMAEQSAICANFSKLMEAQSVLNPDLGALWKERRKFAGAVIRKAVFMELNRESTEVEIDNLIASYRDWVLSSLIINHTNKPNQRRDVPEKAKSSVHKISAVMSNQCKNLFQQGDEMIRKQRPDLAYLLQNASESQVKAKSNPVEKKSLVVQANPQDSHSAETSVVRTDQTVNQKPSSADRALKLSIGGGNNLVLNLPGQKSSSSSKEPISPVSNHTDVKTKFLNGSLPTKLVKISGPAPRPDQGQKKKLYQSGVVKTFIPADTATPAAFPNLIPMNPDRLKQQENQKSKPPSNSRVKSQKIKVKLPVERLYELLEQQDKANTNLIVPGQSEIKQHEKDSENYFAQLGAFAQLENAEAQKNHLESKFSALFNKLPLHIAEITGSGPRFYRIQTSNLSQKHIKTLCDMMWPHKITCLANR